MRAEEYIVEKLIEAEAEIDHLENRVAGLKKDVTILSERIHLVVNSKDVEVKDGRVCFWMYDGSEGYRAFMDLYNMYHEEVSEDDGD